MKNLIYPVICFLIALVFSPEPVSAAFPVNADAEISVKTEKRSFDEFINATVAKYNLPAPPYNGEGADNPALSIASLGLAIGGLAAIAVALYSLMWVLLIPAGLLGIASIILGAMGARRRPLRGIGIAGFSLGIVDLSILVVIGIFAFFVALLLGGF
ncbi:hypothetical protein [Polluticoccus soli]|uniref:hypothetical protein n=1 Tax=Polluticoccus soli TaxID=3034150 RepID=UPI0023E1C81D|nr:hypothetical protein [Flavipsychrobacter sp. JY13-12]